MKLETSVADVFRELEPEEPQDIRELDVDRSPGLEAIVGFFGKFIEFDSEELLQVEDNFAEHINHPYTAKDIEHFSILLAGYQDHKNFPNNAGLYLSFLINNCPEESFKIYTRHIRRELQNVCQCNKKHVIVIGHVAGQLMESGSLYVTENAGHTLGLNISGGEIYVKGNAGDFVGTQMKAGKITIEGNAGIKVGFSTEGGEIHINGDYKNLGSPVHKYMPTAISGHIKGANIYHKGNLIVMNGRRLRSN